MKNIHLTFDYGLKGIIDSTINEFNIEIKNQSFVDNISISLSVNENDCEEFIERINERTSARVSFTK